MGTQAAAMVVRTMAAAVVLSARREDATIAVTWLGRPDSRGAVRARALSGERFTVLAEAYGRDEAEARAALMVELMREAAPVMECA